MSRDKKKVAVAKDAKPVSDYQAGKGKSGKIMDELTTLKPAKKNG